MTNEEQGESQQPGGAEASIDSEPDDVEGLRARLREEQEKAQTAYANWQRTAADFQNLKRRMEEERSEVGRLANAALVINLLPLVDDLERALSTVDSKLAGLTWVDGVWLIYRKFQMLLDNFGVKEVPADGLPFDPKVHEAISEAPGEEGTVVSVVQKGYLLGDRVVRPALVIVGNGAPEAEGRGTNNGDTQADLTG
ncbi:MAG: nucleotide exchange factor GrpE [Dehalococcoidia bacterium]